MNISTVYEFLGYNGKSMRKSFRGIASCRNCKYHEHEDIDDGYICINHESNRLGDWTDDLDFCEAWEERKKENE